jgi:hypothetical protein
MADPAPLSNETLKLLLQRGGLTVPEDALPRLAAAQVPNRRLHDDLRHLFAEGDEPAPVFSASAAFSREEV